MKQLFLVSVLFLALPALSSCAAVGVTLLGAGASLIADQGVGHIMSSRVVRTFPMPLEGFRVATIQTASKMNLAIDTVDRTETGYVITGRATNRRVEIELEWVSDQATRMQVDVKLSFFQRDRATATALVEHTESALSQLRVVQNGNWLGLSTRVPTAEILRANYSHSPSRPNATPSRNDWSRQERWLSLP